jgi:pyruvate dehydrogenase E1 component alpha subunit
VADTITAAVKFAEDSPIPSDDEVYKDIYIDKNYPFIKD